MRGRRTICVVLILLEFLNFFYHPRLREEKRGGELGHNFGLDEDGEVRSTDVNWVGII